jgi:hypothetical protein
MGRRAAATQKEIARAIKAAQEAGLKVARVEIDGTKIIVLTGENIPEPGSSADLDRELAEFEASHGQN